MSTILQLAPQNVWKHFYSLTQIPRPSGHMERITEFLVNFGKSLGLESFVDEVGNVIIRKPATPGMENRKGVILQAHMDMVPQKNNDTVHDFTKDPIETYIDGDWVKAKGTTLGADNGLGVAAIMAVLEAKDLKHGPLEALITKDEETGMYGAFGLKPGTLNGEILLNLDSEDEGELYIGCAGGILHSKCGKSGSDGTEQGSAFEKSHRLREGRKLSDPSGGAGLPDHNSEGRRALALPLSDLPEVFSGGGRLYAGLSVPGSGRESER